jgi:hypothetical protein
MYKQLVLGCRHVVLPLDLFSSADFKILIFSFVRNVWNSNRWRQILRVLNAGKLTLPSLHLSSSRK